MSIIVNFIRIVNGVEQFIVNAEPDTSSNIKKQLMGDNVATLSFELSAMYKFQLGDKADILGDTYYISKTPKTDKRSRHNYKYVLTMETKQHMLRNSQYMFYNSTNGLTESDFSLVGTADTFVDLLITNANRVGGPWVKGGVIQTGFKNITFSKQSCLDALVTIAENFETEFYVEGNVIHVAKKQNITTNFLTYGKNRGLYNIFRDLVDDTLFTRLYVFGGNKNLPTGYRNFSPRLLMNSIDECLIKDLFATVEEDDSQNHYTFTFAKPLNADITGLTIMYRLHGSNDPWQEDAGDMESPRELTLIQGDYDFKFKTIGGPCDTNETDIIHISETNLQLYFTNPSILEKNINKHGTIEGSLIIEDIVPEREGTVTAVDLGDIYTFKDVNIDFDINGRLLPGLSAKVVFQTGQLAGYTFELSKFVNATKEFTILKNKEETALDLPNAQIKPAIGDKYILIDILLPQSYIDLAEQKLRTKAIEYLDLSSEPNYKYLVECDPAYFRKNNIVLDVGNVIHLQDIQLEVDKNIRILSLTRSLQDEYQYDIELGEMIKKGTIASIQSSITINANNTQNTANQVNNSALFNGTYIGVFKIVQGTLIIENIEAKTDLTGLKKLWIDSAGKVWKET